jgi:ABC-type antimicrobial peptide transport system permease subunit
MTWLTAGLIAAGAVFGGFNMLYAAFASRIRELATLQAIGFTRTAVFISLVQESLLATLTGTLCAAFAAVWILEGQTIYFSIGTFSLQMSAGVVLTGLLTGLLLGILGSIPPAIRCLGASLPSSLRS